MKHDRRPVGRGEGGSSSFLNLIYLMAGIERFGKQGGQVWVKTLGQTLASLYWLDTLACCIQNFVQLAGLWTITPRLSKTIPNCNRTVRLYIEGCRCLHVAGKIIIIKAKANVLKTTKSTNCKRKLNEWYAIPRSTNWTGRDRKYRWTNASWFWTQICRPIFSRLVFFSSFRLVRTWGKTIDRGAVEKRAASTVSDQPGSISDDYTLRKCVATVTDIALGATIN